MEFLSPADWSITGSTYRTANNMCLVILAFKQSSEYPLILLGNRDEFHSRPTRNAQQWSDKPDIIGGRDLQAGGTWLALKRNGRFATVTNFRDAKLERPGFHSRGRLVTDFLDSELAPVDFLQQVDGSAYAGFNLLVADRQCAAFLSNRVGRNGYSIPSIVEPDVLQVVKCNAKFILHVEKDTVFTRFVEDKFWEKHKCLLTHGSGQPPRGVRRLLNRLHHELELPVYCLLDNDPWGYYIYSVIKQGSINLAYESKRMAIPAARFIGLRSSDYERCELSPSVTIKLSDSDKKRAKQIAKYPWFEKKRAWQKEIDLMLKNDFKLEVEALISKDISYVTEHYAPERLENKDWLD